MLLYPNMQLRKEFEERLDESVYIYIHIYNIL